MFKAFYKRCNTLRDNTNGAVAIEAAIIIPFLLMPLLAGTLDLGKLISTGQSLTSSSRSGTQYLLNGGRNESELKNVIASTFEGTLDLSNITISASCVCPNANAIQIDGTTNINANDPPVFPYTQRTTSLNGLEQCSMLCNDGSSERALVTLSLDYSSAGFYKTYALNKTTSVRVQ